jgi:hypothetical protein
MAERLEKKWCASNYANAITLKKMTAENIRYPRGSYHDTWEEAHAALLERCTKQAQAAEREFQRRQNALRKAKQMKPPTAAAQAQEKQP